MNGNDLGEPARKRTGSVGAPADEYAIDDSASLNGDAEISNPISGNVSDIESLDADENEDEPNQQQIDEETGMEGGMMEGPRFIETSGPETERYQGRKKRRSSAHELADAEPGQSEHADEEPVSNSISHQAGDIEELEDMADLEGDEAEVILRNEEERMYCLLEIFPKLTRYYRREEDGRNEPIERY
jgi:hypothetical protein